MKFHPKPFKKPGFALIVTLSLMILLTVVAVGLLSLASITLRSSAQGNAMAVARSNARLALMLALGELQKAAGPDKAVTATSEILGATPKKPNLTGVWNSWDYDVKSATLDYAAAKEEQTTAGSGFKGWLVSDPKPDSLKKKKYPDTAFAGESVELVGKKTLGRDATDFEKVRAGKVPVASASTRTGSFAWHVSDEGVKARINTYRDSTQTQTLSQKRSLLAGHRPDVTAISSGTVKLDFLPDDNTDYSRAQATVGKVCSLSQAELFNKAIKGFRNDVTPYSMGLLTNVREGGLKQDLTSLFEMATPSGSGFSGLPSLYSGTRLYKTTVASSGTSVTGISDPFWSSLVGYYHSYKDLLTPESNPTHYKVPPENITVGSTVVQPSQFYPAPVIAKVELMFSLLVRDKHNPHKSNPGDYMLHALYTPIVTLYNPYNVNVRFDKIKVGIADPPIGFTFLVNGVPQNNLTALSNLFYVSAGRKEFWIELADWSSATATTAAPTTMKPGQTLIYGPYIDPSEAFGEGTASYFDYANNKTGTEAAPLKAKRGFTGGSYGFDIDWLKNQILTVNGTDQIAVQFKPVAPSGGTAFKISAFITSKNVTKPYGGLNFTYGSQATLDKLFPDLQRYPKTGGITASAMYLSNGASPAGSLKARSFALFSAYARTANGGVDADTGNRSSSGGIYPDGRLSGNPFLHNNPARPLITTDLTKEKPGTQSHELNLIRLDGSSENVISFSSDNRTNYLTNYRQVSGRSIKSGSLMEVPSGPLQAIADFRRSNAFSSPYLPAFVQPVGNSYASPLMSTEKVAQTGVVGYELLDHSFLANHALYDGSYFSTFAPLGTKSASDGFTTFMQQDKPLRSQVFQGYLPEGKTFENAKSDLFSGSKAAAGAYRLAAQYQMVKGPFNVNSTNVQAWKAMLSSMTRSQMNILWAKSGILESKAAGDIPIPAMSLHNGSATTDSVSASNIDDQATNQWNGYRKFSEGDIDRLATEIVKQVRLRGPFLSMSEFVNRRLGPDGELTRTGALQKAIDDSRLNDTSMPTQIPVSESDVSDANLYNFKTPLAATGNPAAGAPGWLSQADLLKILEPAATVRSDTFVIRTCGEATDGGGRVIARAYAEAVVQRIPEYVNPADPPNATVANPNAPSGFASPYSPLLKSSDNITFGRKFVVKSFKWLSTEEI